MVWIEINTPHKRLYNAELMDEPIIFSDKQSANVPEAVAESVVEKYPEINYK